MLSNIKNAATCPIDTTKKLGMLLHYQTNGSLEPGIHEITWEEFCKIYGVSKHRLKLIEGLSKAITDFKDVGCETIYVGGSFITQKPVPNDFDVCWDPQGVDFNKLMNKYPVLIQFMPSTSAQKVKYGGEFYPSPKFISFFQKDRDGNKCGIIKLNLKTVK